MSATIHQVATLRRLARVYRRILVLAVPAAVLAGCGANDDAFAPDTPDVAGGAPASGAEPATMTAQSDVLGALATDRIVFSSITADGNDVWTTSPTGGTPKQVTAFNGTENYPSWSWDHKQIAFVRIRNYHPDIFVMNADGTNGHWARPTDSPAIVIDHPSWSPDGSHLLVRADLQGKAVLAKLDLKTGNLSLVAPAGVGALEGIGFVYDPTGQTIFYVDYTYQTIKRFTPNGPVSTILAAGTWVGDLAPSPDGKKLAYYKAVAGANSEIYVMNLATKNAKRLTRNFATSYSPTWSPDGTKLAFADRRSGKYQIYTISSSTGDGLTVITDRPKGAFAPAWVH